MLIHVRAGGIWELSVPSSQFCYECKTALKIRFINFLKRDIISVEPRELFFIRIPFPKKIHTHSAILNKISKAKINCPLFESFL